MLLPAACRLVQAFDFAAELGADPQTQPHGGEILLTRGEYGGRKGNRVRAYRRFVRMAYHTWGETQVIIPLPVIVYSGTTGGTLSFFRLEENGGSYEGFSIAPEGSKYEGKLVEHDASGNEVRPLDISITKVTLALLINSVLLLVIILSVAHWYRKHPQGSAAPGGFIGFMEMFIMMVNDDIIKSCVGPKYRKFALTC